MKKAFHIVGVVTVALVVVACGGSGMDSAKTEAGFVYSTVPSTGNPSRLYFATLQNPGNPVLLRTHSGNFGGAAIDAAAGRIFYFDPSTTTDIRVINFDGTNDQLFYSRPNVNGVGGFLRDGRLAVAAAVNGNPSLLGVDLSTKAEAVVSTYGFEREPLAPMWRKDGKKFAYIYGAPSGEQVWTMDVDTQTGKFVGDQAWGGQFAPNDTILSPDESSPNLKRFSESGKLLKVYPTQRSFRSFQQIGNEGFLENGDIGFNGAENIMLYKYDGSTPVNLTPSNSGVKLWHVAELP